MQEPVTSSASRKNRFEPETGHKSCDFATHGRVSAAFFPALRLKNHGYGDGSNAREAFDERRRE
jgi:hypothetical protein